VTNLAALRLPPQERLFPKFIAWIGLGACLFLAFWVDVEIWLAGLALIAVGLIWQTVALRVIRVPQESHDAESS
jgi:APA family basic amino acid/polyamine antiporter